MRKAAPEANIKCQNVVRVNFQSRAPAVPLSLAQGEEREEMAPVPVPRLHPSISEDSLATHHDQAKEKVMGIRSHTQPPREKQLRSLQTLVRQHNDAEGPPAGPVPLQVQVQAPYLCVVSAPWLRCWLRFVLEGERGGEGEGGIFPGPVDNWSLVDVHRSSLCPSTGAGEGEGEGEGVYEKGDKGDREMRGLSFDGLECSFGEELEKEKGRSTHTHTPAPTPTHAHHNAFDDLFAQCALLPGLQEDQDFFLLPPEAWAALKGWYGGGPSIPRFLANSLRFKRRIPCCLGLPALSMSPVSVSTPGFESGGEG
ncbi:hypothetical protein B484DRAFT_217679 [Ochromonadaceae sp. CCMP2298]|nr:hypothetical protein B484DRAFT_217679 [Ochromonadaceae sp. CCMP2298]